MTSDSHNMFSFLGEELNRDELAKFRNIVTRHFRTGSDDRKRRTREDILELAKDLYRVEKPRSGEE